MQTADIDKLDRQNEFWKNVMESWSMIHFKQNIENKLDETGQCILWLNSNIKIGNKMINFKDWFDKGITYIKDIYNHKESRYYTLHELKEKVHIDINFLTYNGLIITCHHKDHKQQLTRRIRRRQNCYRVEK